MKPITIKISVLFLTTFFALCSCTTDTEVIDPAINVNAGGVTGTYAMTAYNTTIPTDLNNDGNTSVNQMLETSCFNGNLIVINSNNTFTATSKGVEISVLGTTSTIGCFSDSNINGTWTMVGNVLKLTYTLETIVYTDEYVYSGNNKLTYTDGQGEIVATTATDQPVYLSSKIDVIYSKQ
jgi:hypothetical protein